MDRLKKRREFLDAARARKSVRRGLVLQARARTDTGPARIGFTATRKIGGAVTRNRAKRRLREAARYIVPISGQSGFDYVLIARSVTANGPFKSLTRDLKDALDEVHSTDRVT